MTTNNYPLTQARVSKKTSNISDAKIALKNHEIRLSMHEPKLCLVATDTPLESPLFLTEMNILL